MVIEFEQNYKCYTNNIMTKRSWVELIKVTELCFLPVLCFK